MTGKILTVDSYPEAVLITLIASFGFHGPPLFTFKTDRLDVRGFDLGKVTSFTKFQRVNPAYL